MADESKWWPRIVGHVLRHGVDKNEDIQRSYIGGLLFCTNGDNRYCYRAYHKPNIKSVGLTIYKGDDLEECRDRIAEYYRTRELFPVDQD